MVIHELVAEDWSMVGAAMHLQKTSIIFTKQYSSSIKAKEAAEENYRKINKDKRIKWVKENKDTWFSGDLGSVAYYVRKRKVL